MRIQHWLLGIGSVVAAVFTVAPIFWVRYIPAHDYPFHLARIAILSMGEKSALFGTYYHFGSWLLPNMAMDAVALPLTFVMSPEMAGKLFLALTQLAFLGGCLTLHAVAFKRWSAWPLLSGLLFYNGIFLFGFFNYLFAAAFALWGAALWLWSRPGWGRRCVAFGVAVVLMWGHMGGFAVYAILVGSFQLHTHLVGVSREKWPVALRELVLDAAPFIASMALFLLVSPVSERAGDGLTYSPWLGAKPYAALFSLQSGVLWADVMVLLGLVALILTLFLTRQLVVNRLLLTAAAMLWLAFVVLPPDMLGSSFADVRIVPLAAMVTLIALGTVKTPTRWAEALVLTLALSLGLVKTAALVRGWQSDQLVIESVVNAMKKIPSGSTLFAATAALEPSMVLTNPGAREAWHPPLKHIGSYASVFGDVFVPMTFADRHKQPMVVVDKYLPIKEFHGDNPFKVYQPSDLVALAKRITEQTHLPGAPAMGDVFLLVVGTDLYPTLPTLAGYSVFLADDSFVIFQATSPALPGAVTPAIGVPHGG